MSNQHPNARTVQALETVMREMQHLVDHPRMQQRNWVAAGKQWLPVLEHAREDLQRDVQAYDLLVDGYHDLLRALASVGLHVEKRDPQSWSYRWHDGPPIELTPHAPMP